MMFCFILSFDVLPEACSEKLPSGAITKAAPKVQGAGAFIDRGTCARPNSATARSTIEFLVSLSRSVPIGGICFALELVNEGRCLTQPFEPLLGGKPVKLSVAVEILARALSQRALEFFAR